MRPAHIPLFFKRPTYPALDLNFASMKTLDPRVTYTGASLATLTNAVGLIEYKPHNLLTYSGDFSNAVWSSILGSSSTTSTVTIGTGASAEVRQSKSMSTASQKVSASVTISVASGTAKFRIKNTHGGVLDNYSSNFTATTTPQTFSLTVQNAASAGDGTQILGIVNASDASSNGQTFIVSGAWLNIGNPQPYYPTTSAAYFGPRFTYDPVTHAALGLLIEEQRTNLATYSQDLSNAVWAKSGSSVSLVAASAPDGGGAYKLVENSATSDHRVSTVATVSIGQAYSTAIYAKQAGRTAIKFYANMQGGTKSFVVDLVTGAVSGSSMPSAPVVSNAGGGYWRIAYTETADITSIIGLYIVLLNGGVESYLGDGASGIYLWGAQLEAGAFATSYIPTTSASVTRAADSATMTGSNFSSWFNATQGTVVVEGVRTGTGSTRIAYEFCSASRGAGDVFAGDVSGSWAYYASGFALQASMSAIWGVGTPSKQAASYKTNDFRSCMNGGAVQSDSSGTITPGIDRLAIGGAADGTQKVNATIARLRYYNTALTNAQLQALTT